MTVPRTGQQLSLWSQDDALSRASVVGMASDDAACSGKSSALQADASVAEPVVCTLPCFRHPRADREIHFSKAIVAYEFRRVQRRSIGMMIGQDGLSVRAPRWISLADVEAALRVKERWICKKLLEQRERVQRESRARIDWQDGGCVPFLGRPRVLKLDPQCTGVVLSEDGQVLLVGLSQHADAEQVRDLVQSWLQREARRMFAERVAHFAGRLNVSVKRVSLTSARTRWGSASADGSIRLHWSLVHFSPDIIDYVVAHELAHLREMNHSLRFWDVVRSVLPDFDEPRQALRGLSVPR